MRLPAVVVLLLGLVSLIASCTGKDKEFIDVEVDYECTPTMKTTDVKTVISDSGIVRYEIIAPLWLVFDEAKEPRWNFSQGLQMNKFDDNMSIDAAFRCDSATYLSNKKLWRFDGKVNATNTAGDRFLTNQLFWNQIDKKVYTDSFIHIERSDRTIEGYGFESNENMTNYTVNRVSGIFPVNEMRPGANDSTATDTLPAKAKKPAAQPQEHKPAPLPERRIAPEEIESGNSKKLKLKQHNHALDNGIKAQ